MTPFLTTSRLQTCRSIVVFSGFISHSVLQSFCLGTVRHGRLVWPSLTDSPPTVMITAEPYFLSQLQRPSLHSTFASYLATSFTLSNFCFLGHATVTSKKACLSPPFRSLGRSLTGV